jgi:hypothetical protein
LAGPSRIIAAMLEQLPPLPEEEFLRQLIDVVDQPNWSVIVVLTTGDTMIGDLLPSRVPYAYVGTRRQAHYPKWWAKPERAEEATAVYIDRIDLRFPVDGEPSTAPAIVQIPREVAAAVHSIGWSSTHLKNGITYLVGPIAESIAQANLAIAARASLKVFRLGIASLQVPKRTEAQGIVFERSETIYIDYRYFERLASIGLSVGLAGTGAQVKFSVLSIADASLKSSLAKGVTLPKNIERLRGTVAEASHPVTVQIEGEACEVILFRQRNDLLKTTDTPLLLKTGAVAYPRELWQFIRSELTILAEHRQIPIEVGDRFWSEIYFARAIGYIA